MSRRHWALLLALAAIWGASYLFIEIALRDFSSSMVAAIRIVLGALVLTPVLLGSGVLRTLQGRWGIVVFVAMAQVAAPFVLIGEGQEEIPSALAGILVASAPVFTAILAVAFVPEERSEGLRLVGVLVGIGGVVILLGVDLGGSGEELLGGFAIVLASLGYAIGALIIRRRLNDVDPVGLAAVVLAVSAAITLPLAVATWPAEAPGLGPLAAITVLGAVGTGIAFAIYFRLLAEVGAARAFIVTYLAPGFAVVYGVVLLDEELTVATFAGLAAILAGAYLAVEGRLPWRPSATGRSPRSPGDSLPGP